jgi:hypothetical protein
VRAIVYTMHLLEQVFHRCVAGVLNASGAELWKSVAGVSGATLAIRFQDVLGEESNSINSPNSKCYTSTLHNEYPALPKCFGFPLSQYSCPRETQLVVGLLKGLLSQISGGIYFPILHGSQFESRNEVSQAKVCILCSTFVAYLTVKQGQN